MKTNLLLFGAVLVLALVWGIAQRRTEQELQHENSALREQVAQSARVEAENQRLSNTVVQARGAQKLANERLEELVKLRGEVNRLVQANQDSNLVAQAKMADSLREQAQQLAALRSEIGSLFDQIGNLREELADFGASAAAEPAPASEVTSRAASVAPQQTPQDRTLSLRMINTHAGFAEKLKRSVAAKDDESFQDVFGRFLQSNGIDTEQIIGLVYDDRTGRVIVRGPNSLLDVIERATVSLDGAQ